MALILNERYPGRFNNPDSAYPQGSFKNRTTPTAKDGSYLEKDWANDKEGFFQSLIAEAGVTPDGLPDEVGASQYFFALIAIMQSQIGPNLNSTRIEVASASTVDLVTLAPDTRHINITGTTTINGFTVGAGQCYFVRFNGVITLANSASLVTQSGSNITAAAGDTCILRATAADTVEILCYTPGIPQELGYRQTWQNVLGSRSAGTPFTNTTGKPISVSVVVSGGDAGVSLVVGGVTVATSDLPSSVTTSGGQTVQAIIPNGATYQANLSGGSLSMWAELR